MTAGDRSITAPAGTVIAAWQAALAAEQRAAFGYGLLGPRLPGGAQTELARAAQTAHDELVLAAEVGLRAAGTQPVPPAPDYPDLYPVQTAADARARALGLETSTATAWRALYAACAESAAASVPKGLRATAQQSLTDAAVRASRWRMAAGPGAATVAFPGV